MIWEIVNPSDACTIKGSESIAALAILLLGEGRYGMTGENGERPKGERNPLCFLRGPNAAEEFSRAHFGRSLEDVLTDRNILGALQDALKTFRYVGNRSSMNNIGKRADGLAKGIRAKLLEFEANPASREEAK